MHQAYSAFVSLWGAQSMHAELLHNRLPRLQLRSPTSVPSRPTVRPWWELSLALVPGLLVTVGLMEVAVPQLHLFKMLPAR
jgi:hypothetical protein